jgi:hypothetical protein
MPSDKIQRPPTDLISDKLPEPDTFSLQVTRRSASSSRNSKSDDNHNVSTASHSSGTIRPRVHRTYECPDQRLSRARARRLIGNRAGLGPGQIGQAVSWLKGWEVLYSQRRCSYSFLSSYTFYYISRLISVYPHDELPAYLVVLLLVFHNWSMDTHSLSKARLGFQCYPSELYIFDCLFLTLKTLYIGRARPS